MEVNSELWSDLLCYPIPTHPDQKKIIWMANVCSHETDVANNVLQFLVIACLLSVTGLAVSILVVLCNGTIFLHKTDICIITVHIQCSFPPNFLKTFLIVTWTALFSIDWKASTIFEENCIWYCGEVFYIAEEAYVW